MRVWREGREYKQSFSRGRPLGPLEEAPAGPEAPAQGTQVRFLPDPDVFKAGTKMEPRALNSRLRELGFLNSGAAIRFRHIPAAGPAEEAEVKVGGAVPRRAGTPRLLPTMSRGRSTATRAACGSTSSG